jgi:hypothetical protein
MPPTPRPAVLSAAELEQTGRALFGDQWVTQLARALDINLRTMRHLARGTYTFHEDHARALLGVITQRGAALAELAAVLAKRLDVPPPHVPPSPARKALQR